MGINVQNFLNTSINQNLVNTLQNAKFLKEEWREKKSNNEIHNVLSNKEVKDFINNNIELKNNLFNSNKDLIEKLGKYHFTTMTADNFFYVWKFINEDKDYYLYYNSKNVALEADKSASNKEIFNVLEMINKII